MTVTNTMTVLDLDHRCGAWLRPTGGMRVVHEADPCDLGPEAHTIIIVAASELPRVAKLVKQATRTHRLRGLLVHADVDEAWIGEMLDRAGIRSLRRLLVHRSPEQPRRVVSAWLMGSPNDLIADAVALPEALLVRTCALERIEVPWAAVPALAGLPVPARARFAVAGDGSHIHWPDGDVDLDLDAIRAAVDPAARARARAERLSHDRAFGTALAAVRAASGLRQRDIPGLTARQVRRIEAGASFPRVATLERLASAHGMTLDDYLNTIADHMAR